MKKYLFLAFFMPLIVMAQKTSKKITPSLPAMERKVQNEVKKFVSLFEKKFSKQRLKYKNDLGLKGMPLTTISVSSPIQWGGSISLEYYPKGKKVLYINGGVGSPLPYDVWDEGANGWSSSKSDKNDGIPSDNPGRDGKYANWDTTGKIKTLEQYYQSLLYYKKIFKL